MKSNMCEFSKNNFKKLFVLAVVLVGTTILAQEKGNKPHRDQMEQFTPEQKKQLMLKKMTLELDLSDSQQKEMGTIISEKMAKRETFKAEMKSKKEKGVKPTTDERFAMEMKMLDEQIANKKRMAKLLNPKQYEKWTAMQEDFKEKRLDHFKGKHKGNHPGKNQEKRQG